MAVTSQVGPTAGFGELTVKDWRKAGLIRPSGTKPILAMIEVGLVVKKLGQLQEADRRALQDLLRTLLG